MATQTTKKLINNAENSAWEGLNGMVSWNPGYSFLPGHKDVVLRRDWQVVQRENKVALITGGGSGHEPLWAGYVGKGMLTGAVHGDVFAAPSVRAIFATIMHLGKNNPAGVLVLFCNYTGDRLNFSTAVEKARTRGVKAELVRYTDDCALQDGWKDINRRGLSGFILLLKAVGHLAETGAPLEKVGEFARNLVGNISTMGAAWAPCSLPGAGPLFLMEDGNMELGLGIHGEAGIKRVKMDSTKNTVNAILTQMLNKDIKPPLNTLARGDRVVVLLNNLGATTDLEMNVLAREVISQLDGHGIIVERLLSGRFVTSLEMAGISISLMQTDDFKTSCIDAATTAQGWTTPCISSQGHPVSLNEHMKQVDAELNVETGEDPLKVPTHNHSGPSVSPEEHQLLLKCLSSVANSLVSHKDLLNSWDTVTGDGDCGNTHASAAKGLFALVNEKKLDNVYNVCTIIEVIASHLQVFMGGTSGGIYGLLLTSMAQHFSTESQLDISSFTRAFRKGIDNVVKYAGAPPGSRTMVDALSPTVEVLEKESSQPLPQQLMAAAKAAEEGAKATLSMKAKAGRAVYVDQSLLVHPDPGARAVSVWIGAIVNTLLEGKKA